MKKKLLILQTIVVMLILSQGFSCLNGFFYTIYMILAVM